MAVSWVKEKAVGSKFKLEVGVGFRSWFGGVGVEYNVVGWKFQVEFEFCMGVGMRRC